jgi:hypothetical protein
MKKVVSCTQKRVDEKKVEKRGENRNVLCWGENRGEKRGEDQVKRLLYCTQILRGGKRGEKIGLLYEDP